MAEFTFAKTVNGGKKRGSLTGSNIAYALFVLFCANAEYADPRARRF